MEAIKKYIKNRFALITYSQKDLNRPKIKKHLCEGDEVVGSGERKMVIGHSWGMLRNFHFLYLSKYSTESFCLWSLENYSIILHVNSNLTRGSKNCMKMMRLTPAPQFGSVSCKEVLDLHFTAQYGLDMEFRMEIFGEIESS